MKKLFIIGLSMLMLMGLTASAFATDITISGEITVEGEVNQNTTDFNSKAGDRASWYDEKVGLKVDAKVTPNTSGVIQLETDGGNPYGNWVNTDMWGNNASAATGWAEGNTVTDIISIREAYILHTGSGLLGMPAGIKIGRMSAKLGRGLFFDHSLFGDQGIFLFVQPTKGMEISLTHLKLDENTTIGGGTAATPEADDTDSYTLAFSNSANGVNVSADFTWAEDQDFVAYTTVTGRRNTSQLRLWNLGVRGDATVGIANLYGDLELQYGRIEGAFRDRTSASFEERKLRGGAILLGGTVDVNPARVNVEFAYGTGDKCDWTRLPMGNNDTFALLGNPNCDSTNRNEQFLTTLGADQQHYTYVYEDRVISATGARGTGLANTWYIKTGAEADINPDLTVGGDIYFLRASQSTNLMGARNANNTFKTSSELGLEIDGNLTYKIDTNLVYFIQAGYLIAGKAYDIDDPASAVVGQNKGSNNPYVLRHGISLMF
jgi:hypothetical protein